MEELDIPITKKLYELYRVFYGYRTTVPKQDRYTIWQKCDDMILGVLEYAVSASRSQKLDKLVLLEQASSKLNMLRIFIRLMKDTKVIDNKKYTTIQTHIDEIGRMLGGWMRSIK